MLTVFVDTDCDITPAFCAEYGFKLISMPYCIDGKTYFPYEDTEVDLHKFYNGLREGVLPTTAALSVEKYKDYFRPEFEKGNDVFYVHFSKAMTCTFDAMDQAVDELKKEFPERKFYSIDTKGITIVSYNIIREIGDMLKEGKTVEDVLAWGKTEINKFAQYFFADDLKFFRRSGRVSGISATFGTLLGIRPIIYMNPEGQLINIGKENGRKRAMQKLLNYVDELGENVCDHRIIVGHTDFPEMAQELADKLKQNYPTAQIEIICTNPTAGSHCGPNGVGVSFHCTKR